MLPQTLSMFAGQHSWYDPKDEGISCEKCHQLEYGELAGCAYNLHSSHRTADRAFECTECHNVSMNVSYYFNTGNAGEHTKAHAASTVSCLACHQELFSNGTSCDTSCHRYGSVDQVNAMHVLAWKYNMSHEGNECLKCHKYYDDSVSVMKANVFINHVDSGLSHPQDAHRAFFMGMSGENTTAAESGLSGSNEACLGCHSSTGVNISWTRCTGITFDADKSDSGWQVGEMSATGSDVTFISRSG